MKVLVISNYMDYHTTRPEANIFKGLAKVGVNVTVMSQSESPHKQEFLDAGAKFIDFNPQTKGAAQEVKIITEAIKHNQIDILHAFSNKGTYLAVKAAKQTKVKLCLYRGYAGNLNWYDPTAYLKHLNPRVDAIMCNSQGVTNYFHKQLFFEKSKAVTINKGHDIAWYNNYEKAEIKKELNLPTSAFLCINVANNRRMKGIPFLLQAITLLQKDENIHLLLAGRDMDSDANKAILNAKGYADRVHFLGFRKDVLSIIKACDLFVLSSLFGESITKSVIESMALGTPAVITDIPGNTELITNGTEGLVVPSKNAAALAQAIITIAKNTSMLKAMGDASQLRIQNELSAALTVKKVHQLYETLLS